MDIGQAFFLEKHSDVPGESLFAPETVLPQSLAEIRQGSDTLLPPVPDQDSFLTFRT
jgi:hypothetical protein